MMTRKDAPNFVTGDHDWVQGAWEQHLAFPVGEEAGLHDHLYAELKIEGVSPHKAERIIEQAAIHAREALQERNEGES
jgi:hypothetical protein